MAVQTFGTGLRQHPHFHCLVTDGVFFPDGQFWPLGYWNTGELCDQVRASVLHSLVARQCLSEESADIMKSWPIERSGFSVFVGEPLTMPEHQTKSSPSTASFPSDFHRHDQMCLQLGNFSVKAVPNQGGATIPYRAGPDDVGGAVWSGLEPLQQP